MIASLCLKNVRKNERKLIHHQVREVCGNHAGVAQTGYKKKKGTPDVDRVRKLTEMKGYKKYLSLCSGTDLSGAGLFSSPIWDGTMMKDLSFQVTGGRVSSRLEYQKWRKEEGKFGHNNEEKCVRVPSAITRLIPFQGSCFSNRVGNLYSGVSRGYCTRRLFGTSSEGTSGGYSKGDNAKVNRMEGEALRAAKGETPDEGNHESGSQSTVTFTESTSNSTGNSGKAEPNGNEEKQSLRQIYMHKKQREKMIKMYLLLSLLLMPFGQVYLYCIENDISMEEFFKILKNKTEMLENKYNDILQELIDKYFPLSNEPLLPDFKDLNYPENLPTLVIDLNYVIAKLEYDRKSGWRVLKRPYADMFFKELSSFYEIVIWSEDNFPVAQEVISKWGIPAIGCLHRDQCSKKRGYYVKDLKRLGRNLDRVVIIDHDAHAFMLQPENGILIKEFHGDVNDKEILSLIDLLKSFAISSYDISQFLKKYGGGDYNIGKRYMQLKSDTEQKSQRIRNFGKIFHLDGKRTPNGMSFNS
ncbi:mitochondrial import inner membrane translocase subunit TIM50, putative [Plasmodium knowlesi strain H]|uniref:Mitochondrial import inner membrane translocase subunit TIM50 n=3 Tax=Plasmodium knowlesi TaxID=5850 RepID=A0A5K1VA72_PLAKH|nr:uncharacterized protein PKNH_0211500 [Plasmodium knowlesi strain H]OTN66264.1 putative Mitochondrial import inner membrane translocase subunit TIM50 [Plasmodium knowlesi]CAA9986381.1 mitochondrial import inner membrane translocase subunit TIM50, putative [Plasmodium knowlesi strain H]SBO25647.1 mitochondrial import inner membrane translocase subunit TIM50, putative [Plasmodium knowlesi strain H]SBO28366.1 mitochondrial import inner membrane translocase subunit TIM50, putative [Plasmodium kno|eukprot:XP_002257787.1 [Plasmodium knowlesi strain H]